jgi:hypothetical protein
MASGLTSGMTSSTSGSIWNTELLSTTTAPLVTVADPDFRLTPSPALDRF